MPIFFEQKVNENTRLGIWKIEENEAFFKGNVPRHRDVTHPHKRLQHLAGRFLLQFLVPDFPYHLIEIADTRKPFLPEEQYHFSISHCGDFAAAIVSKDSRVGIDIEIPVEKILRIADKFLSKEEHTIYNIQYSMPGHGDPRIAVGKPLAANGLRTPGSRLMTNDSGLMTLFWSAKESVYKWYGNGGVDFRKEIQLQNQNEATETIACFFSKNETQLIIHYRQFDHLVLAWVVS